MSKPHSTSMQRMMESQERVNAALREFNRKAALDLPIFKARVAAFIAAVKSAAS